MKKNELKPEGVFAQFAKINTIPRPSKHEERMIEYLRSWGESHKLETIVDETGNVLIRKPATKGYEDRETIILQSHMDMVCDKLVDKKFDFDHDAIQTYIDGEWMKADGTTLGADDGIGDAIELALLESNDIEHGPIECVFTRDEETGLTGANGMKAGFMTGNLLINLDSEDEGQVFVSCAGGISTTATFTFEREKAPKDYFFVHASVKGLKGGHSGDDIDKKRANAIKLLTRFIYKAQQQFDVRLVSFDSGTKHNAIPRDGVIVFAVPDDKKEDIRALWNVFTSDIEDEYHVSDTAMQFTMESTSASEVLPAAVSTNMVRALQAVYNGVLSMCQDKELEWMVETSSNVAIVETAKNKITIVASQRSNVTSSLENMANSIKAVFELADAKIVQDDSYPAWKMNPNSKLIKIAVDAYKKLFGKEPIVRGIHAGLECGLFSEKYPHLDMVSFGPTLRNVHTPDECLHIPTVQMVWDHLIEILKNVPKR